MGASVFGAPFEDSIYLNDATLWSGEPVNQQDNPGAQQHIADIREALTAENYALADSLQKKVQGHFSQSYAPLGTLFLSFLSSDREVDISSTSISNYRRSLDLEKAISRVSFTHQGIDYTREYFISQPDQVMVIRLTASQPGALNFKLKFGSQLKHGFHPAGNDLLVHGYAPYHAEPSYRGDIPDAVKFDPARGTRFTGRFKVRSADGRVKVAESSMALFDATEATILMSIATSFNGFDKDPAKEGLDSRAIAHQRLSTAATKTTSELRIRHLRDYQSFYQRLTLHLGETKAPDLPTDDRLIRYATGKEDKNLEILYHQYGRYLMIASSRTPDVPANLQGIWNPYLRPPWSSNYTLNINAEENYWPAEIANLSELHEPLLGFIENIAENGRHTARNYYGTDGWVACHNSDIWAMSNPVGDYGQGDPSWANWNMGGVWLSTHLWEHYLFTRDEEFLRNRAYPVMKGAAQFCLNWLVKGPDNTLLTSPSTSPEAKFITDEGYTGATLYGATADLAMIRELFAQVREAGNILETDVNLLATIATAEKQLAPYQIGKGGHLQEWYHDWADADPRHRHQSHLFGLYPGHHISPEQTPELAEASKQVLEIKGDETTGWSKGWRINLWARLKDGNRAYKMLRELLRYVEPSGLNFSQGGGTYPNLFDAHPPFQIDGNFGGAAAILELIIQSGPEEIHLLPALPEAWPEGTLSGVCTRTGHVVDLSWKNRKVTSLTVKARHAGSIEILEGKQRLKITLAADEVRVIK